MQIVVVFEDSGDIFNFDVDPKSDNVENLKALCEIETKIPILQQEMFYQNFPLKDDNLLEKYAISESDIIVLKKKAPPRQSHPTPQSHQSNVNRNQPQLVGTNNVVTEQQLLDIFGGINHTPQLTRQQELERRIQNNPFDIEAQKLLEEEIQRKEIEENYLQALEHTPETFFAVHMLYVPAKINGHDLKAFVDSGAQMSIMSKQCAEKCGLMRLLDKRYKGVAKGVGSCEIMGRIHLTLMILGKTALPVTITVLNQTGMSFLLGLDMLKRHQMMIDLKDNCLRVGDEQIKFLPQNECPNEMTDLESPKPTSADISRPNPFDMTPSNSNNTEREIVITQLMETIGIDRESVMRALEMAKGNAEVAASILFDMKERMQK